MALDLGFKYEFGALGIDGLNRNIVIKGEYGRDTKANAKTLKGAKPKRRHTDTVTDTEEVTIINSNANSTNQIESEKKHAKSSKSTSAFATDIVIIECVFLSLTL